MNGLIEVIARRDLSKKKASQMFGFYPFRLFR
jgi:hypothetical protein